MSNNRVTFSKLPATFNNVRTLGSLVFDKRSELGSGAYLDLSDLHNYPLLSRDLIAALYELASPSNISSYFSIAAYKTEIRNLVIYCKNRGLPSSFRLCDIDHEFLLDYRIFVQMDPTLSKSTSKQRRFGSVLRLFKCAQIIGLVHSSIIAPRNFRWENDSDRTQPYSSSELLDLEATCRLHIRKVDERLNLGKDLLKAGVNPKGIIPQRNKKTGKFFKLIPKERAWNKLENLLWYVVHEMNGEYLKRHQLIAGGHSSFNNSVTGVWKGIYRKGDVYSHLYPLAKDLIPFLLLIALKTGRNESSIYDLDRDCVQRIDDRFYLLYKKLRSGSIRYKKPIDNEGQFSPVSLIKRVIDLTAPLVEFAAPEYQNRLFLGLTIHGRESDPVKPLDACYHKAQMNCVDGWCDEYNLQTEHGKRFQISLRRLRVSYLTKRYRKTGQLGKISNDAKHAKLNTTVPYVENEGTRHLHEQATLAGIKKARDTVRPTVLPESDVVIAADLLDVAVAVAEAILIGEQDVMFAACKNFYHRPGGSPNVACDKPWACLGCSNSVITRHVLPRIIAFRKFMDRQRICLPSIDWNNKFLKAWMLIDSYILPKFSDMAIAEATELAEAEIFYLPIAWKY